MLDLAPIQARPGQLARRPRAAAPTIWAVASGKGGVGKSVLCASLAVGLSQTGPRSIAVDLDLGGGNLHTLFGCERAHHTLSDLAQGRVSSLADALAGTTVPGVRLLSGARAALDAANASRAQTQRILRGLAQIDAGHVVLDLGAGTSFHTLDAFVAADRRLLVVTPEATAIENAYHFLKAAFFRAVRDLASEADAYAELAPVLDEARRSAASPRELVEAASRAAARAGARLRARLREFEVFLVVNRVSPDESGNPAEPIAAAARTELGMNLRPAGSLADDASVPAAVERGVPVMQLFPGARFCTDVQGLVASLFADDSASATRAFALAAPHVHPAGARAGDEWRAPLADVPSPHRTSAPGRYLRERREQLGLDLRALHERTRIRHHYLEAIEAERFEALPPDFFAGEYVRQIAETLGIPEAKQLARHFVEKGHATRGGVSLANAVLASALPPPRPERAIPSAEELLSEFDAEPEIEAPAQ
ncbi:MAG: hypothetical protein E6J87_10415 [Deltaproteobacteria bacterium]|nr:MAG: hypothetical protein E6J87_10415 [Deltaproteobacteria bacterium]